MCLFWASYWKNATPLINNHLNCDSLGIIDLLGSEFSTRKKLDELILMAKLMFIVANTCRLPGTASHLFLRLILWGLSVLKHWHRRCETCTVAYWLDLAVKKKIETWNEREIERVKGRKKEVHKRDERICPGELLCHPWDTINNCRHSLSPWKQAAMLDRRDTLCWNDRDIQY